MAKPQYNWEELKAEYLTSDIISVSEFMRHKVGTKSAQGGTVRKGTAGWQKEKEMAKREALKEVMEEEKEKMATNIRNGLNNLINFGLLAKLTDSEMIKKMPIRDVKELWKMLKTELGEPTFVGLTGEDPNNKFNGMSLTDWIKLHHKK